MDDSPQCEQNKTSDTQQVQLLKVAPHQVINYA